VRVLAVFISLQKSKEFSVREKLFIGLNMPKGIALATVILVLSSYNVYGLNIALQLALMVMIYSIVFSFVLDFYARPILGEEVRTVPRPTHSWINVLEMDGPSALKHKTKAGVKRRRRKRAAKAKAVKEVPEPAKIQKGKKQAGRAKKKAPAPAVAKKAASSKIKPKK
jgi:hypothetical protein